MAKYHINPKTGNASVCRAKKNCPFGGDDAHYPTKEAAAAAYEAKMEQERLVHQRLSDKSYLNIPINEVSTSDLELDPEEYDYDGDSRVQVVENALWHPFKSMFGSVGEASEELHSAAIVAVRALDREKYKNQENVAKWLAERDRYEWNDNTRDEFMGEARELLQILDNAPAATVTQPKPEGADENTKALDVVNRATGKVETTISFSDGERAMPGYIESVEKQYEGTQWFPSRVSLGDDTSSKTSQILVNPPSWEQRVAEDRRYAYEKALENLEEVRNSGGTGTLAEQHSIAYVVIARDAFEGAYIDADPTVEEMGKIWDSWRQFGGQSLDDRAETLRHRQNWLDARDAAQEAFGQKYPDPFRS